MEDAGEQREAHDGVGGAGGAVPAGSLPLLNSALLGLSGVSDSFRFPVLLTPRMIKRVSSWETYLLQSIRGLNFMRYLGSNSSGIVMEINPSTFIESPLPTTHSQI